MARFSRQGFLGPVATRAFAKITVGIVGLGGGGSHVAQQLAHLGVGRFILFDPDIIEDHNLNRTVGATEQDVSDEEPKVQVSKRVILAINSKADVQLVQAAWSTDIPRLRDCDFVFGCLDTFQGRADLETSCRRAVIPLIDIGMDVHGKGPFSISGQIATSLPGMHCLRCYGIVREDLLVAEAARYGSAGGRPQVVWPNGVLASTAVGVFVQLVAPWRVPEAASLLIGYDGDKMVLEHDRRLAALSGASCPHFPPEDVGDPLWEPIRTQGGTS